MSSDESDILFFWWICSPHNHIKLWSDEVHPTHFSCLNMRASKKTSWCVSCLSVWGYDLKLLCLHLHSTTHTQQGATATLCATLTYDLLANLTQTPSCAFRSPLRFSRTMGTCVFLLGMKANSCSRHTAATLASISANLMPVGGGRV